MGSAPDISLLGAFAGGILSFLSPCVLPLVPSFLTYLTGLTFADLQAEHPTHVVRQRIIIHSLLFIAGFTIVFVLLGASATFVGSFLREHMKIMQKIGAVLIMLFGLHVSGLLPIRMLLGEKRVNIRNKPAGYLGSILVGITFAAGWTPCIGPILASILMVAAAKDTVYHGIILLLAYSLGLGIPFFLSSLAIHRFLTLFNRFKKFIRIFEITTGIFLIVIGILIFFDRLTVIQKFLSF
ncbi:MAG TPA: cytochrome c biogenesis protein CcdA [Geobacteraceae bacterium]|nr:cytochrome c biogenesis protein CcdA [Geobacteraceae bacterium]